MTTPENTNVEKPEGRASAPRIGWVVMRSDLSGCLGSNGEAFVFGSKALAEDAAQKYSGIAKSREEAIQIMKPND